MAGADADDIVLEVRGARRRLAGRVVLDGVDLRLRRGHIHALLGPNGAGKTSLMRAVCGRLRLDEGSVRLAGADPREVPAARRSLGVVPQSIALYPHLSARENLEIFGRLSGMAGVEVKRALPALLERVGLDERARQPTGTLSGGMQRRLNIAAGLLHRPAALLLDEPTVGVDPNARELIHELLGELRSEGLAILLATHDLEQAETLADRIAILHQGRIRAEGAREELVREVLGDGKELTVTLSSDPSSDGRSRLEQEGLAPVRGERGWAGRLAGGFADLSALSARLAQAGLAVSEVRVREPGLRGVFFRLTGENLDP